MFGNQFGSLGTRHQRTSPDTHGTTVQVTDSGRRRSTHRRNLNVIRQLVDASAGAKDGEVSTSHPIVHWRAPALIFDVDPAILGSSADGNGEEGIDRGLERTGALMYLGE